jgi:hypothetical protein
MVSMTPRPIECNSVAIEYKMPYFWLHASRIAQVVGSLRLNNSDTIKPTGGGLKQGGNARNQTE